MNSEENCKCCEFKRNRKNIQKNELSCIKKKIKSKSIDEINSFLNLEINRLESEIKEMLELNIANVNGRNKCETCEC